ncbi:Transposase DDE domain group 1 [Nitrosomonas sp. Nm34]|nr:Transposase DDE domain group 1 [Nitrosomonas sp. Nm34]
MNFEGGDITSDGSVMLLRQVDKHIGLSKAVAQALEDNRRQASCKHGSLTLLRQRVYALACGYEDLNDHQQLCYDLAIQSAVEREEVLASSSTLCRWENQANRQILACSSSDDRSVYGFLRATTQRTDSGF